MDPHRQCFFTLQNIVPKHFLRKIEIIQLFIHLIICLIIKTNRKNSPRRKQYSNYRYLRCENYAFLNGHAKINFRFSFSAVLTVAVSLGRESNGPLAFKCIYLNVKQQPLQHFSRKNLVELIIRA